jgi:hypothetical protein
MNASLSKHVSLISAFQPGPLPGDPPDLFQHIYTGLVSELSRPSLLAETLCAQLAEAVLCFSVISAISTPLLPSAC